MAKLILQTDEDMPLVQELHEQIIAIGRNADNTIVIGDDSVSGHHGEIVVKDGDYILRDLNSANGISVNYERIAETILKDGDVIHFGSAEARFEIDAATAKPKCVSAEDAWVNLNNSYGALRSNLAKFKATIFLKGKQLSQLALLKAKIEKIKYIDLSRTYRTLGCRASEIKFKAELLQSKYIEIAELEKTISAKQTGAAKNDDVSEFEKLKQAGKSAIMAVEAEVLESKLKRRFIVLGQMVEKMEPVAELVSQQNNLCSVKKLIEELEEKYTHILEGRITGREWATQVLLILNRTRSLFHCLCSVICDAVLRSKHRKLLIGSSIAIFCTVAALSLGKVWKHEMGKDHRSSETSLASPQVQSRPASVSSNARQTPPAKSDTVSGENLIHIPVDTKKMVDFEYELKQSGGKVDIGYSSEFHSVVNVASYENSFVAQFVGMPNAISKVEVIGT